MKRVLLAIGAIGLLALTPAATSAADQAVPRVPAGMTQPPIVTTPPADVQPAPPIVMIPDDKIPSAHPLPLHVKRAVPAGVTFPDVGRAAAYDLDGEGPAAGH